MSARSYRPCPQHVAGNTGRPTYLLRRCIPCAVWLSEHPEDARLLCTFVPGTHLVRASSTYSERDETGKLKRMHLARRKRELASVPPRWAP